MDGAWISSDRRDGRVTKTPLKLKSIHGHRKLRSGVAAKKVILAKKKGEERKTKVKGKQRDKKEENEENI